MPEQDSLKTVAKISATGKRPRDFVYVDEFWRADECWPHYFFNDQLWVYVDSYNAELVGDEDYCRIIIDAGKNYRWRYQRDLQERENVFDVLQNIVRPVSENQLKSLGFTLDK
ncbi:MAG: hypothetical protein RJQ10_10435 [Haliea sp.]|uniref:hypothetical protein n=1 Tax=Haliea sp. TaxID=1932666 RepID=UPI0032ED44FB